MQVFTSYDFKNENDYEKDIFSKRLCELIEEKKTTKSAIATELHISRQAVMQYCNGNTFPTADKLRQLAVYFNVSADYLLGLSSIKHEDPKMQQVEKYTGLSEKTVNMFHSSIGNGIQYSDDEERNFLLSMRAIINQFLESEDFLAAMEHYYKFLQSLENVQQSYFRYEDKGTIDSYLKFGNTLKEARMERYDAIDCLTSALLGENRIFDEILRAYRSMRNVVYKSKSEGEPDGND